MASDSVYALISRVSDSLSVGMSEEAVRSTLESEGINPNLVSDAMLHGSRAARIRLFFAEES